MKAKLIFLFMLMLWFLNPSKAIVNFKNPYSSFNATIYQVKKPLIEIEKGKKKMNIFLKFSIVCGVGFLLSIILYKLIPSTGLIPPFIILALLFALFCLSAFIFGL